MIFNVSDTSLVIDELENGTPYQFALRAYTTAGESGLSEPREAAPTEADRVPGAPGQPSAVFDTGEVSVSWPAPDDVGIVDGEAGKITGYNIHYSQDADDIRNGAVEEVRPTGEEVPLTWTFALADGGSYYFAVAAVTGAGAGELSAAVQTDRAPGKPSKPQALPGDGTIRVRWHAPADSGIVGGAEAEITGYKVYYREEGAVGEPAFKDAGAADREAVLDLTNGLTYFISVAAVNGAGEGEPSDEKEAEPTAGSLADRVPDEPWDVRVIEGDGALTVTWRDPADSGVFQGQEAVITKFEVYYTEGALDPDALTPEEVDLAANPDAERRVELTGLTNGNSYNVAVRTVTSAGTSPLSAVIEGTPQIPDQVPGIPSITLTEAEHEKVRIRWSAPDTPGFVNGLEAAITGYRIYYARGVEPAKTSSFAEIEDGAALEGAVTNLVNGRTYHFAVLALNGAGEGELSEPKTAQPYRAADRPPGAPRQEFAPTSTSTEGEAQVSWQAPDETGRKDGVTAVITGYRVYYRLMSDGTLTKDNGSVVDVDDPDKRAAVISGLTNGVEYQFAVTAVNAVGEGELSAIKTLTLLPDRTVSFDVKEGSSVPAQTVTYGSVLTEPAPAPTLTGHALEGWYTQDGSSGGQWGDKWDFNVDTAAETMTLYARWQILAYRVTYNSYQGSAVDAEDVTFDSLVTEPGASTKTDLDFVGWYREDTLTTPWNFGSDKMEAQDMTLHAKWEAQVTFELENGEAAVKQRVDEGAAAAKPSDPAKTGYTFAEWYTDPQGTTPWNFADPLTGHTTLYAGWTANDYTAAFVPNNGESDITEDFGYETLLTAPAPAPVRMGHALAGWFKQDGSSNGQWGVEWDFAADKMALGGVTLYAKWDIQSYQVTFESHGGSGVDAQTAAYDTLVTAPAPVPTRQGYTFAGWYEGDGENNGGNWGTPWNFDQDEVGDQDMTLYARWYSPPSAPGNLAVSSYDDDSVTLSWDGSNNPGSSGGADAAITDYKVYYSTTNPVDTSSASSVSTNTATTARISGLTSSTSYYFVVLAANSVGLESAPSNEAAQTTDLSDTEKAAADKGDLDITSAAGGDLQAVKADFTLPVTGGRGTAISWAVTSGTAIALVGTNGENADVTRPTALGSDDIVVLRAAITLGSASETKDFTLTVKKVEILTDQESVDQDTNDLTVDSFQFAQGDTYTQITQDFTLPITGGEGSEISWTLTSGSAVSLSGTRNGTAAVTRPDYLDGSATVELEARITKNSKSNTKSFTLTVYRKDRVDIASPRFRRLLPHGCRYLCNGTDRGNP